MYFANENLRSQWRITVTQLDRSHDDNRRLANRVRAKFHYMDFSETETYSRHVGNKSPTFVSGKFR